MRNLFTKELIATCVDFRSRDITACEVTGYGLDDRGSILGKGRDFFFAITSRSVLGPTGYWGAVYPGINVPDYSLSSSGKFKNA